MEFTPTTSIGFTQQQQAHIDHMTEQFRRFAEGINRANAGVGRYTNAIASAHDQFKFKPIS